MKWLFNTLCELMLYDFFFRPFALLCLALIPFLGFGAEMEMKMYLGEDEGDSGEPDQNSPGGIVVETLVNIRTVASLTIEDKRSAEFSQALRNDDPTPIKSNFVKGSATGLGQFVQMWGIGKSCFFVDYFLGAGTFLTWSHYYFGCLLLALMYWWGAWLLLNYPSSFSYRDFLFSMFSMLFGLEGIGVSMQGATDRDKAKLAAHRIFELIDRQSAIDPLSEEGKKDIPPPRNHERHKSSQPSLSPTDRSHEKKRMKDGDRQHDGLSHEHKHHHRHHHRHHGHHHPHHHHDHDDDGRADGEHHKHKYHKKRTKLPEL